MSKPPPKITTDWGAQFIEACIDNDVAQLRLIQPYLPHRYKLFTLGLECAANHSYLELFQELCTHPFYRLQTQTIYHSLLTSLQKGHTQLVEYAFEAQILSTNYESEGKTEKEWALELFYDLCVSAEKHLNASLGFLLDYLETNLSEQEQLVGGTPFYCEGFRRAWRENNPEVINFLIQTFELTGEEPGLAEVFDPAKPQPLYRTDFMILMRANKEHQILEAEVKNSDTNSIKTPHKI